MDLVGFRKFLKEKGNPNTSSADVQRVIAWLHCNQALDDIESELKKDQKKLVVEEDFESIYQEILNQINEGERQNTQSKEFDFSVFRSGYKNKKRRLMGIAASVIILLASAYLTSIFKNGDTSQDSVQSIVKRTSNGEKLNVQLADGTRIKLNGGSSITYYPESYLNNRQLELEGEAYFEVTHNEDLPFRIIVNEGLEVRVMGTSFIVNASNPEQKIVAVKSGKVSVKNLNKDQSIILSKNEFIEVSEYQTLDQKEIIKDNIYFGWIDNELVLDDASFYQVLHRLYQWYGYEIEVSLDYSEFDRYSGSLTDPTLKEVMESLSHSYKFNYSIDEKMKQIKIK